MTKKQIAEGMVYFFAGCGIADFIVAMSPIIKHAVGGW